MNSETAKAARGTPIHSLLWHAQARAFALLLAADVVRVCHHLLFNRSTTSALASELLHAFAFALAAYFLWFHVRTIFATASGLQIRSGKSARVIPWNEIVEMRAIPMTWLDPPWYPLRFEVDLTSGDVLEFVGRRDAREVVRSTRSPQ